MILVNLYQEETSSQNHQVTGATCKCVTHHLTLRAGVNHTCLESRSNRYLLTSLLLVSIVLVICNPMSQSYFEPEERLKELLSTSALVIVKNS